MTKLPSIIENDLSELAAGNMANCISFYKQQCDVDGFTPIEAIFYITFMVCIKFCCQDIFVVSPEPGHRANDEKVMAAVTLFGLAVILESQMQLEDWRVDFLLSSFDRKNRLIIECDGHDFHERTKEQAIKDRARDRRFQQLGYGVFRFPGAEIYSSPVQCVNEVLEWMRGC